MAGLHFKLGGWTIPQNGMESRTKTWKGTLYIVNEAVKNQWNGMVEWNTRMEYWNE